MRTLVGVLFIFLFVCCCFCFCFFVGFFVFLSLNSPRNSSKYYQAKTFAVKLIFSTENPMVFLNLKCKTKPPYLSITGDKEM